MIRPDSSGRHSTACRREHGYTLTELLIVMGILALLVMLGSVWFRTQIPLYRLNGAARQIRADLLAARMQAVSQGHRFRVVFLDDEHRYEIVDDANNNGKADSGEQVETKDLQDDYPGVTIQSTNNPIFHPRGSASSLATVTVTNESGERKIKVGITGRVKIDSST